MIEIVFKVYTKHIFLKFSLCDSIKLITSRFIKKNTKINEKSFNE